MKKIVLIAHERAGYLQLAPLYASLKKNDVLQPIFIRLVRRGEESLLDDLSGVFGMRTPDHTVTIDPSSPVEEIAAMMVGIQEILIASAPELLVPGGCDNGALAAVLAASKLGIPVACVDAGLRSCNRAESGEINRILIDSVATLFCVSERSGLYNLMNEGVPDEQVMFTGNLSIDSLVELVGQANESGVLKALDVEPKKYAAVFFSRQPEPGARETLELILSVVSAIGAATPVLFHRTSAMEAQLKAFGLDESFKQIPGVRVIDEPGYIDMIRILKDSIFVLTDSEEFQAELTVMNVPCLTMQESTARPSTIEVGTNALVGADEEDILERVSVILSGKPLGKTLIPEKWDGASALRVAAVIQKVV